MLCGAKAWTALQGCVLESGKLGFVQPPGAEPAAADADSWEVYGAGAFLLAGSEILNLEALD